MVTESKKNIGKYLISGLKTALISIIMGAVCGVVGALFSHSVSFVTNFRAQHGWILYLLPAAGLLSVFLYHVFRVTGTTTDDAVESAHTDKKVSPRLMPAVFICSVITHLFGGSAGREGAALKMGGGIAAFISDRLGFDERSRRTAALAGMSGVFAAVFGTPVGAGVFSLEVVRSRSIRGYGILTSLISSISAYFVAVFLGAHPERYHIGDLPGFSIDTFWKVCVIAALAGIVSFVFCHSIEGAKHTAMKIIKNEYVRIAACSLVIVGLTILVGTTDYNGGGIGIIEGIFEGEGVRYEAFALKILFTALTVAAGFKGGEIVPAFFTGATFGAVAAGFLGLSPAFGAAVGMTALFCGVTNCPIATLILSVEMFGFGGIGYFLIACILSFAFSGEICLYDIKKIPFDLKNRKWIE